MSSYTAFTPEGDDSLFLETCDKPELAALGKTVSPEKLEEIWKKVYFHFTTMSSFCPSFWQNFEATDLVDISVPATSFYNMSLAKIRWKNGSFPELLAQNAHKLLTHKMNVDEVIAFNAFINAMIKCQSADPVALLSV